MASGGEKPGDAKGDLLREKFARNDAVLDKAITRLEVRADMQSMGEEEISAVIDQRALEAQRKKESDAPPKSSYGGQAIIFMRSVKSWPQVIVALSLAALAAWYMWLHK